MSRYSQLATAIEPTTPPAEASTAPTFRYSSLVPDAGSKYLAIATNKYFGNFGIKYLSDAAATCLLDPSSMHTQTADIRVVHIANPVVSSCSSVTDIPPLNGIFGYPALLQPSNSVNTLPICRIEPTALDPSLPVSYFWQPVPELEVLTEHGRSQLDVIFAQFRSAFYRAESEDFEPGTKSNFSTELDLLASTYGTESEGIIRKLLLLESTPDVAAETMRWLGNAESYLEPAARASLIHIGLTSHSVLVRDSAALALGSLNADIGIRLLSSAIQRETNAELRSDMEQILQEIEILPNGQTSDFRDETEME